MRVLFHRGAAGLLRQFYTLVHWWLMECFGVYDFFLKFNDVLALMKDRSYFCL
jgi:hypothetical protein